MAVKKKPKVSFDTGMKTLEKMVNQMQSGNLSLEEMMSTYERGMEIAAQLESILAEHRRRIEQIDPDTAEITTFEEKENGVQ